MLFKYLWNATAAGRDVCSLYAVRMEANHRPGRRRLPGPWKSPSPGTSGRPTTRWSTRSHTQLVEKLPLHATTINVGGADHPVVESLRINLPRAPLADGKPVAEVRLLRRQGRRRRRSSSDRWVTYGKNLAEGKPYTCTRRHRRRSWGAGDPDGKILTDGVVGSPYVGGTAYQLRRPCGSRATSRW